MGFKDFWKKMFSVEEDAELQAARKRHGMGPETPEEQKKRQNEEIESYDPWEDIRNVRSNFFFGSWATKKYRTMREDKLKADLEKTGKDAPDKQDKEK